LTTMDEEEFGLAAYREIQAELGQWGEESPVPASTPRRRYSPGRFSPRDDGDVDSPATTTTTTPASYGSRGDNGDDGEDATEEEDGGFSSPSSNLGAGSRRAGPAGVQTPKPPRGLAATEEADKYDFAESAERLIGDGIDSYRPYHDALLAYLRSKKRASEVGGTARCGDVSMMSIDGDDLATEAEAALEDAEMRFLSSLSSVCLSRGQRIQGSPSEGGDVWGEASDDEGNFWDLLSALRAAGGLPSLFYVVDGEEVPDLTLSNDPAAMVAGAPADVLEACLGGEGERCATSSLPLRRLMAALGWIEACHCRRFEKMLQSDYEGNDDPILPPPRRRTMWPGTLAALKRRGGPSSSLVFHPDAPLRSAFGGGRRSSSPVDVSSFLAPEDEVDDARLLRACFMLFQAGRTEEATRLVDDCGQPWRAAAWTGGEPLSADGVGNPTRWLWKGNCRKVARKMLQIANADASSMADGAGRRGLYPSLAYEAAIMSLLSDDVDAALRNPVFRTWEDGVHAILRSELGIIEDDVLRSHNGARVEAFKAGGGHFPYAGTEINGPEGDDAPRGNDGDLGATLQMLEASPVERVREGGGDPFRNGMTSFLVGQNAPREYMEECAALSLEAENDDEACFLRFVTHLILYVDAVLPEFCSQLALPAGMDAAADGVYSLRDLLILKYVAYLSSRRDLWPHVALYTSLLSQNDVLDTYSSFLIHVHDERERQMTLRQARDLFPEGMDIRILRNVVRGMVMCDEAAWAREAGEEAAPAGVAPADARMMRSVLWLCHHPEHAPDALVCTNMLLRRFLLSADASNRDLRAPKVFMEKILPKDLVDAAVERCRGEEDEAVAGPISLALAQNLKAEFLSIESYLRAHTKYVQFLDAISKTSPCHQSNGSGGARNGPESDIADRMERNAFRQKKAGLCKIVVELATRASNALSEVLTFGGGWLVDVNSNTMTDEEGDSEEAGARSEELAAIRSAYVPWAVSMLREVSDNTAVWLEQVAHDTLVQFGETSEDMLMTLFESFGETYRSSDDCPAADLLTSSRAAPGYWHKKALSLASVVANDGNSLHETFDATQMEGFLKSMAEHAYKLNRCSNARTFFVH